MKRLLYTGLALLVISASSYAQKPDTTEGARVTLARMTIDTGFVLQGKYGFGQMRHTDLGGSYADNRLLELHVGWRSVQSIHDFDIPGLRQSSLFFGATSTSDAAGALPSESNRFGARTASGYGWISSAGMLLPYTSSAMVWTKLDIDENRLDSVDRGILFDFDNERRFGNAIEAGIELISDNGFSVRVGIERTLVFPRHLVFKELLSSIIQGGIADAVGMTSARMIGSPTASPLVSFILSSAVRFGISELRREEMNWPFTSAPPLVFDTFEFGVAFTF